MAVVERQTLWRETKVPGRGVSPVSPWAVDLLVISPSQAWICLVNLVDLCFGNRFESSQLEKTKPVTFVFVLGWLRNPKHLTSVDFAVPATTDGM